MSRRTHVLVPLALLAVLLLAGCLGGSDTVETADAPRADGVVPPAESPDPVTVITDAEGDATQKNSDWAREAQPCASAPGAPTDAPNTCAVTDPALQRQEPAGAVPADPARDVLEVRFQETPETLEVSLDVAELGENLDGAIQERKGADGYHGTTYYVNWKDPKSGCTNALWLFMGPGADHVNTEPVLWAFCQAPLAQEGNVSGPCTAPVCNWEIPFEIKHGAPATLHWSVPRAMLASSQPGETIPEAEAGTWHTDNDQGPRGREVRVDGPVATSWFTPGLTDHVVDATGTGTNYTFSTPQRDDPIPAGRVAAADEDVRVEDPPTRPDLRIHNLTLEPSPERFRFEVVLEKVAEDPRNHTLPVVMSLPGHQVVLGYAARDGQRQTFAQYVGADGNPVSIPVSMSVELGTPGHITFELQRSDLPEIPDGALLQQLVALTGTWDTEHDGIGGSGIARSSGALSDVAVTRGLHRISADPGTPSGDQSVRVGDAPQDVEPPPDLTGPTDRYDLLGTEVVSPAPDEMRFALTVDDLSDLSPPRGYDAVFYAVGIEHPNGETMVGHYRSRGRLGGEFLCAPDTTVLADQPSDPTQTAWTQIEGAVLTSSSSQGIGGSGGGGSSGSIVVTAPPSCFGLEEGAEDLNITTLESGSYLVRRPSSQAGETEVSELDALEGEEAFAAGFAQPAPPPPPGFWAQPFGIENFWDILGGFLAIVTISATIGVWLWRRWTFRRYLDEVERIHEEHRHDARARATALVELRRDLYEDLDSFRLSDSHYPIILDRLRARLTSARLTSLGQTFYDLPPHLALRIERMLDDGHLAEEECGVLESVIEESGMPEDSRGRLGERLRTWVAEDREHVDVQGSGS